MKLDEECEEGKHSFSNEFASDNLKRFISYGRILTEGSKDATVSKNSLNIRIENVLSQCRHDSLGIFDTPSSGSTSTVWTAVQYSMQLLDAIEDELIHNDEFKLLQRDVLGVRDLQVVHTLIEIVISWGITPLLSPGVGLDLSKRVRSGYAHEDWVGSVSAFKQNLSQTERQTNLEWLSKKLSDLCLAPATTYSTVSSIIRNRYLTDVFTCLLELGYGPYNDQKARDNFERVFDRTNDFQLLECLTSLIINESSPPPWLRSVCGHHLSQVLLRENGIQHVIEYMSSDMDLSTSQLDRIARLIMSKPKQFSSIHDYYNKVLPQMISMLKYSSQSRSVTQSVVFTISQMTNRYPKLMSEIAVPSFAGPFLEYSKTHLVDTENHEDDPAVLDLVIISNDQIRESINLLHGLLIGNEPSPVVINIFLSDSILALYDVYAKLSQRPGGGSETKVFDLLMIYFRIVDPVLALNALKQLIFRPHLASQNHCPYFDVGLDDQIVMRVRRYGVEQALELPIDVNQFVDFLQVIARDDILSNFMLYLLSEYSAMKEMSNVNLHRESVLVALQLIMCMLEKLDPKMLNKPVQLIAFADSVLKRYKEEIEVRETNIEESESLSNIVSEEMAFELNAENMASHEEELGSDSDIVLLAISLLAAVLSEHKELPEAANTLLKSTLATIDYIQKAVGSKIDFGGDSLQDLIFMISARQASLDAVGNAQRAAGKRLDRSEADLLARSVERYQEAMKLLQDRLLPVRAHGLNILCEMVLQKDSLVSEGQTLNTVLDIFITAIQDDDSFIYLNAIKGLSAMTDIYGKKIMEKLVWIYRHPQGDGARLSGFDKRLRVGEALLQTIQRCGETFGRYVSTIVPTFLHVVREETCVTTLRMSALSLLGTCCQVSPFALTEHFETLVSIALDVIDLEKAPEVRRAAIVLILSLVRGLASQVVTHYPAYLLKSTYTKLSYVEATDADELTRHQARTALADLTDFMRGLG